MLRLLPQNWACQSRILNGGFLEGLMKFDAGGLKLFSESLFGKAHQSSSNVEALVYPPLEKGDDSLKTSLFC
jgi:hypothetical protein